MAYTVDPPALGWCGEYAANYAISACDQQINEIYVSTYQSMLWFVIAAWAEPKVWCGTEFGFGDYVPGATGIMAFLEYGPCYAVPGQGLEIPTPGWPGPNEGTAFVVTEGQWAGNFVPVYYFAAYAYGYGDPGVVPLALDPPTSFAGTGNCSSPPTQYDAVCLGGMGVNMPGIYCCPVGPREQVCCDPLTGLCMVVFEEECLAAGWNWRPDLGESCDPNPCPPPPPPEAPCCFENGTCSMLIEADCDMLGGIWHPEWDSCDPNLCPQPEAVCCNDHICTIATQLDCEAGGGIWHPEFGESCDPNPCEIYTGTDNTSWGTIKGMYR
jgi:hypothetical protein